MSTATTLRPLSPVTRSFNEQLDDVIAVAQLLNETRNRDDFEAFQEACRTAGLTQEVRGEEESVFYWKRINPARGSTPIDRAQSNVQLAYSLGIELHNADTPRCRLLYRLVETTFPDLFRTVIMDGPHVGGKEGKTAVKEGRARRVLLYEGSKIVADGKPKIWCAKLYLAFQGHHPSDFINQQLASRCRPLQEHLGKDVGLGLGKLLFELKMILPPPQVASLLGKIFQRAAAGQKVHLVGAFCPDYAYEETGDPNLPYRYTFDNVGTGVGLVALQFARVIRPLSQFLTEWGIDHHCTLGIGDFEADSEEVLRRVGCDYQEFVRRCAISLQAFQEMVGEGIPMTLELCDKDRCNGRLRHYSEEAFQRMMRGDFGRMTELYDDPERLVRHIVKDNGSFYRRWFSTDLTDEQVREKVLMQGAEYAALARIYGEDFGENVIHISGDRPMMHAFDAVDVVQPVLCVKRAY